MDAISPGTRTRLVEAYAKHNNVPIDVAAKAVDDTLRAEASADKELEDELEQALERALAKITSEITSE